MCLAPLILAGYLFTLHPNQYHPSSFNGPLMEVQSCERGIGADLKVGMGGIGSLSGQYGLGWDSGPWRLTLTPKAGVGYIERHVPELTSQVNFSLGAQVLLGYQQHRFSIEYLHHSNAGLGDRNAGLDMIIVTTGIAF